MGDEMQKKKSAKDKREAKDEVIPSLSQILGKRDFHSDADLEAFLEKEFGDAASPLSDVLDPWDEAQSLIYEAWNTQGPEKIKLARRALELSKNCADAYVILAEAEAKSTPSALALYQKALKAAVRTLPSSLLENGAGHFWGVMETRPYMRARLGIAMCLRDLGKIPEALDHMREMLRLNSNDNQGVRYILLECLLKSKDFEEIETLLESYPEDSSAAFCYTQTLCQFRRLGPVRSVGASLAKAVDANPHIPAYLLKRIKLRKQAPEMASPGSREEAETYAIPGIEAWRKTKGAVEWLNQKVPDDAGHK